ncbi:MAG: L,D-transpeptidase [Reyranellaceae bacterium]
MQEPTVNLLVQSASGDSRRGVASLAGRRFACALGSAGIVANKREGDGGTPTGRFPPRFVLYRADRLAPPRTVLKLRALEHADGWCDQPGAPTYNSMVRLPHPFRHERLWRDDHLYDLILVIGHNDAPPIAGRGSAIFIHLAREDYGPTEGCIAFAREDLLEILSLLTPESNVVVQR